MDDPFELLSILTSLAAYNGDMICLSIRIRKILSFGEGRILLIEGHRLYFKSSQYRAQSCFLGLTLSNAELRVLSCFTQGTLPGRHRNGYRRAPRRSIL